MIRATILNAGAAARGPELERASGSLVVFPPDVLLQAAKRTGRDLRLVLREPASGKVAVVVFRQGDPTMVFCPGDGRSLGELLLAAGLIDYATLESLLRFRDQDPPGLAQLLVQRVGLAEEQVQAYLDFQARMRLLDVLSWQDGFFEIHDYLGGGETAFSLQLPRLDALILRARARARNLPELLARLPAAPSQTVVRRRRGAVKPIGALEARVFAALSEPLLLPHLAARLLLDDDVACETVVRLAASKVVTVRPRVALAPPSAASGPVDPRLAEVVRELLYRARGPRACVGQATLWVLVVSATPGNGARLVAHLGGEPVQLPSEGELGVATGLIGRTVSLSGDTCVRLLALCPNRLTPGALEGVLARFEAVVLLRAGGGEEELEELSRLARLLMRDSGPKQLVLGFDLQGSARRWGALADAVLFVPGWEERSSIDLLEGLLEGLLAATAARAEE